MKTTATAEVLKITPAQAAEWLSDKWGEQRQLRSSHVKRLAADMEAGRFKTSPDAILRIKGKLANGQHRMSAVVLSGKPQTFIVMESSDEELYKVIDAGLRRTVADGLIGAKYAKEMPPIARWVQAYSATFNPSARGGSEAIAGKAGKYATQIETIDYCLENQMLLEEAATFVVSIYVKTKLLSVSIGGAIFVIAATAGKTEEAKEFLQQVYIGTGDSAAIDLRNRLIANKSSRSKFPPGYVFGITIKAFRSFLNGSRPGVLKWAKDESLPKI